MYSTSIFIEFKLKTKNKNCQILFHCEKICFDSREEFPICGQFLHGKQRNTKWISGTEMDLNADFKSKQLILEEVNISDAQ